MLSFLALKSNLYDGVVWLCNGKDSHYNSTRVLINTNISSQQELRFWQLQGSKGGNDDEDDRYTYVKALV
jgi:hypothetical protein